MRKFVFFKKNDHFDESHEDCRNLFFHILRYEDYITTVYPKEYEFYGYKIRVNYIRIVVDNITGETGYICNATKVPTIMGYMYFYIETIMQYEL